MLGKFKHDVFRSQFVHTCFRYKISRGDNLIEKSDLPVLLKEILVNNLRPFKCIAIISDGVYLHAFRSDWFKHFGVFISYIMVR